jgi:hypothetical protein
MLDQIIAELIAADRQDSRSLAHGARLTWWPTTRTAEMVCQNCGDRHKFPEPSPFEVVMAEISEFCQRHENCKPVAAEQG